ncbi:OmpA family protein [Treponema sp. UBA3813]|uniref:OmpA family protein n=1 Tax=Treponema sp. UBA3813 TaxID=1947715 RepID=UPI0025FCF57C|nr:OmpA family protein [Treponema sp. UBA3813]
MKKSALIIGIISFFQAFVFSQTKLTYSGDSSYKMVERTNLRRYVNGKYSGLTSREVRSFISRSDAPDGIRSSKSDRWYDGNFFVVEETLRNSQSTMAGIHDAIPSVFKISADGKMTMISDNGYPTFRSFPSYTTEQLKSGDSWKGEGERAVDPMNKGIFTRIPILVRYTFEGAEVYKGENVYRIKAIWQTNYGFSNFDRDPKGDDSLRQARGGHKADIIVRQSTGEAILISDNVDETFTYTDGTQVNLKGTITMFTEYPPAIDRDKLIFALNRIAKADDKPKAGKGTTGTSGTGGKSSLSEKIASSKGSGTSPDGNSKNNMVFEETPAGIRLSVRDIKFKADSDEVLATEKSRLDEIAEVLKLAPNSQFLIEGHTAAVGKPQGEQALSVQRARRIAAELSNRGIAADRFICKGLGGTKPVASNSTDEGRAQNRRVEITILE